MKQPRLIWIYRGLAILLTSRQGADCADIRKKTLSGRIKSEAVL